MTTIGMVLSGGGARCIAHLGIIKALREMKIPIHCFSGTSAGAIAAVLIAAGNEPEDITRILKHTRVLGMPDLFFEKGGIFNLSSLRSLLERYVGFQRFQDLPVPVYVAATDLAANKTEFFHGGPLIEPILASASVPFIFQPASFQGKLWVDGGILNNFPVEPLLPICDRIIGSHVNCLPSAFSPSMALHKKHIVERCFHMAIAESVYAKKTLCSIFLDTPCLPEFGMFDTRKADRIFETGYRFAMQRSDRIRLALTR